MALTKTELIFMLQNEVRILLHLTTKIDPNQLDYRPTPKQRSTIELLRYLSIMGPGLVPGIKSGEFDGAAWGAAVAAAGAKNIDQIVASLAALSDFYATELGKFSEADFAEDIEFFYQKHSRGVHVVSLVLRRRSAARAGLVTLTRNSRATAAD
jgi:hypothetical protein